MNCRVMGVTMPYDVERSNVPRACFFRTDLSEKRPVKQPATDETATTAAS